MRAVGQIVDDGASLRKWCKSNFPTPIQSVVIDDDKVDLTQPCNRMASFSGVGFRIGGPRRQHDDGMAGRGDQSIGVPWQVPSDKGTRSALLGQGAGERQATLHMAISDFQR